MTEIKLSTIAAIVLTFTDYFPDVIVYVKGNTRSRNRLDQMALNSNFIDIEPLLHVYGFINGDWQEFNRNVNYEAFLVLRK